MEHEIRYILANLRPRDRDELAELGFDGESAFAALSTPSVLLKFFSFGGNPVAVIAFHALTPKSLAVSLLATDHWGQVARRVMKWGLRVARPELLSKGFERAECRTLNGHASAVKFLQRLGFHCECRLKRFGATGAEFHQYAWRLEDHVFSQNAQSTAATAGTAPCS